MGGWGGVTIQPADVDQMHTNESQLTGVKYDKLNINNKR